MNISFYCILLTVILQHTAFAQDGFVVKAGEPNFLSMPQDMVITPDNSMIFLFTSIQASEPLYINEIRKLNPVGDITNTFTYADTANNYVEYTHCLLVEDTLYVFGWGYRDPITYESFLLMQKLDLQLNLINTTQIRTEQIDPYGAAHGQVKYVNGKFYCVNNYGDATSQAAFYAEISKEGDLLKLKADSLEGYLHYVYDFIVEPNNGGFRLYSLSMYNPAIPGIFGTIDFYNEEFIREDFYIMPYDFLNFFTHTAANDSIYYISGQRMDWIANDGWRAGFMKMKNDTTLLNALIYSTTPDSMACPAYRHSIEVLPDGNIIFCFNILSSQMFPTPYPGKINLMKLTPDLEVIWHRYIGEPNTKYDAYEVHTTSSDEIVILGAYSLAPYVNSWDMQALFIKTNSEGIITGTNDEPSGVRSTQAIVYPNPAADFVQIEFSMAYTQATFSLLDISGKTVFEKLLTANKQNLDISGIPAGTYIYRVYNQKGLDESGKLMVE